MADPLDSAAQALHHGREVVKTTRILVARVRMRLHDSRPLLALVALRVAQSKQHLLDTRRRIQDHATKQQQQEAAA